MCKLTKICIRFSTNIRAFCDAIIGSCSLPLAVLEVVIKKPLKL